jgi:hypothetical protein
MTELQQRVKAMLESEKSRREVALKWLQEVTEILSGEVGYTIWGTPVDPLGLATAAVQVKSVGMDACLYFRYGNHRGSERTEYPGFYVSPEGLLYWGNPIEDIKGKTFWEYVGYIMVWVEQLTASLDQYESVRQKLVSKMNTNYQKVVPAKWFEVKEIFLRTAKTDSDWSLAADKFVQWCISRDFNVKSYDNFVDWIDDDQINSVWRFWFGYDDNYDKFADDWVTDEERGDYLTYCREHE